MKSEIVPMEKCENQIVLFESSDKIVISNIFKEKEADKRNPGMDIISTLANEFHVSVDYLVSGKTSEDDNLRVREWSSLIRERSQKDIESALKLVRVFFECMDSKK